MLYAMFICLIPRRISSKSIKYSNKLKNNKMHFKCWPCDCVSVHAGARVCTCMHVCVRARECMHVKFFCMTKSTNNAINSVKYWKYFAILQTCCFVYLHSIHLDKPYNITGTSFYVVML